MKSFCEDQDGAAGRENVGMSNHKWRENRHRRKPKVSSAMAIIGGLGVPKCNHAFGHGITMVSRLIFLPHIDIRRDDGEYKIKHIIGFDVGRFKDGDQANPVPAARHIRRRSKPPQGGMWLKSPPRKVSKITMQAHVPITDTGGLV